MIKYENETYLDTSEASNYLGKTTTAFRQFIQRNDLPRRKLGGRLFFPVKELDGYFAKREGYKHFEDSGLSYDDVYNIDQILAIILTTRQNIYHFLKKNKIERYKDNSNKTLYSRKQIDALLSKLKTSADDL